MFDNIGSTLFGDNTGDARKLIQAGLGSRPQRDATGNLQTGAAAGTSGYDTGLATRHRCCVRAGDITAGGYESGLGIRGATSMAGSAAATNSYMAGLRPSLKRNYNVAAGGQDAYADASGANGAEGMARARANFTGSPSYQFDVDEAMKNTMRTAAAGGTAGSGGVQAELLKRSHDLANQNYMQYMNGLMPFLGQANTAAGGISDIYKGLAGAQTGAGQKAADFSYQGAANAGGARGTAESNVGQLGYSSDVAKGNIGQNLGNSLANLNYQVDTGAANAAANEKLANEQQGMGVVMGGLNALVGGMGGRAASRRLAAEVPRQPTTGRRSSTTRLARPTTCFSRTGGEGGHFRGGPIKVGETGRERWFPDKTPALRGRRPRARRCCRPMSGAGDPADKPDRAIDALCRPTERRWCAKQCRGARICGRRPIPALRCP